VAHRPWTIAAEPGFLRSTHKELCRPIERVGSAGTATVSERDAPSLLENFLGLPGYEFTPKEEALAARMAAYWTNFAKTGDPNGPGLPLWLRYTSSTERINVLDEPAGEVTGYRVPHCTFLDPLHVLFGRADEYTPPPMIR
jgi:hypothetical protein